jgi:hypothetical protein
LSRNWAYVIYKEIYPEGPISRKTKVRSRPPRQSVPGPDYQWSLDAYCKLEFFGIQIYAAIDSYSRNIVWSYVGISNRTVLSCAHQYCQILRRLGYRPKLIRSDRGNETIWLANSHYFLAEIEHQRVTGTSDSPLFKDHYKYGTSKSNHYIEKWWGQMARMGLNAWRVSTILYISNSNTFVLLILI